MGLPKALTLPDAVGTVLLWPAQRKPWRLHAASVIFGSTGTVPLLPSLVVRDGLGVVILSASPSAVCTGPSSWRLAVAANTVPFAVENIRAMVFPAIWLDPSWAMSWEADSLLPMPDPTWTQPTGTIELMGRG